MPRRVSVVDVDPGVPVTSPGAWAREIWRRWLLILFVLFLTVSVAGGAWSVTPKAYTATAAVNVSAGGISEGPQSAAAVSTLLATQVQVLQSTQLANEVASRLDGSVNIVSTTVEGVPESQVATVSVTATTAAGAAGAANEFVLAYQERRNRGVVEQATSRVEVLQTQINDLSVQLDQAQLELSEESQRVNLEQARITIARDSAARAGQVLGPEDVVLPVTSTLNALQARYSELAGQLFALRTEQQGFITAAATGDGGVAIVSVATEPANPSTAGLGQSLALAAVLGLGLGTAMALLLGTRDRRLHDVEAARRVLAPAEVLVTVDRESSRGPAAMQLGGVLLPAARSTLEDAYLEVVLGLAAQWPDAMRTLLVCSPSWREDKIAAAGSLAVALAKLGRDVVLVDVGRSSESTDGVSSELGLLDVVEGRGEMADALVQVDVSGDGTLHVLAWGRSESGVEPTHAAMREVLRACAGEDRAVVIQGPPLAASPGSVALAPDVDGVLVPILLGATRGPELASACGRLTTVGGRLLGVVAHQQNVRIVAASKTRATHAWMTGLAAQPDDPSTDRSVSWSSRS